MRILFACPRFHSNQRDMVEMLLEHGHRVSFLVCGCSHSEDHSILQPVVAQNTKIGEWLNNWLNRDADFALYSRYAVPKFREVWRYLHVFQPDLAVLRGITSPLTASVLLWLFGKGVPIIVYTQGPRMRPSIHWRLRLLYWMGSHFLNWGFMTPVERRLTDDGTLVSHKSVTYIPFIKRICPCAKSREYRLSAPRFMAVGKFLERKNHTALLYAFNEVRRIRRCSLSIIGENVTPLHRRYYEKVCADVAALGLQHCVRIVQNAPIHRMSQEYEAHDVFVMASYHEPASISQLEAMSHGLPVICGEDNGTAAYVRHGFNGFHCSREATSIAERMRYFLEIPEAIPVFGAKSVELLETDYNADLHVNTFLGLARRLQGSSMVECFGKY